MHGDNIRSRKYIITLFISFIFSCFLLFYIFSKTYLFSSICLYAKLAKLQNSNSIAKDKLPELISILSKNNHWLIKSKALDIINSFGESAYPAVNQLLIMIQNEEEEKALKCAYVLKNIICPQNRDTKEVIIRLLERNYNNISIPMCLIESLGKLKEEAITSVPYLENRLSSERKSAIRDSIKVSLHEITGNNYAIAMYPNGKAYIEVIRTDKTHLEKYIEMKFPVTHEAVKIGK